MRLGAERVVGHQIRAMDGQIVLTIGLVASEDQDRDGEQ
jgi:hypothetical protein